MAPFKNEEIEQSTVDWRILRGGGISLYKRPDYLQADLDWLKSQQYDVRQYESGSWSTELSMHDELSLGLGFPSYYGRNLDALDECMCEDVAVPDEGGLALVLNGFDKFAHRAGATAYHLLHIAAKASRQQMLRGKRFIVLIQTDDPLLSFQRLGGVVADWNQREWLSSHRTG